MVEIPPRVDLHPCDVIGIVEFASETKGTLPSFATQRFTEALQRSQPGVLVLEQGPDVTEQERAALFAKAPREFNYAADYNDYLGEDVRTPTSGEDAMRLFGTGGTALHYGGWMVRPIEEDMRVKELFGYRSSWGHPSACRGRSQPFHPSRARRGR